jgi:hypothetical protein
MSAGQVSPSSPRVFTVAWDAAGKKFVARDDRSELLGTAAERAIAIAIAIRCANAASRTGGYVAVQVLMQSGKYRTEYITPPIRP